MFAARLVTSSGSLLGAMSIALPERPRAFERLVMHGRRLPDATTLAHAAWRDSSEMALEARAVDTVHWVASWLLRPELRVLIWPQSSRKQMDPVLPTCHVRGKAAVLSFVKLLKTCGSTTKPYPSTGGLQLRLRRELIFIG